jgi:hypothetical protein
LARSLLLGDAGPLFCGGISVFNPIVQFNFGEGADMKTIQIGLMAIAFTFGLYIVSATQAADSHTMPRDHLMVEPNDLNWADGPHCRQALKLPSLKARRMNRFHS